MRVNATCRCSSSLSLSFSMPCTGIVPGMFYHAGLSWLRVVRGQQRRDGNGHLFAAAADRPTVIGAFLLVLSLLRGFGCVDSLLRATKRVAIRSPHAIPQSAVIGSMAIGTVSGSGAANSITVGSATISGHDPSRSAAGDRSRDREFIFDGRSVDAASYGYRRIPDGRIPWRRLF